MSDKSTASPARRFNRLMTRLGAHYSLIYSYFFRHTAAAAVTAVHNSAAALRKKSGRDSGEKQHRTAFSVIKALIFPVICVTASAVVIYRAAGVEYVVDVEFDGENIGTVSGGEVFDSAQKMFSSHGEYHTARLKLRPMSSSDVLIGETELLRNMEAHITPVSDESEEVTVPDTDSGEKASDGEEPAAYAVYADRKLIGIVDSCDRIEGYLERLKSPYEGREGIDRVFFDKDITFEPRVDVPEKSLVSEDDVISVLSGNESEPVYYSVVDGDTLYKISDKLGITLEELRSCRAVYNGKEVTLGDSIHTDTVIEVQNFAPFLSVEYTTRTQYERSLPCEVVEMTDENYFEGEEVVESPGNDGISEVYAEITYRASRNEEGQTEIMAVHQKVLKENILTAPSARVVTKGTRKRGVLFAAAGTHPGSGEYFWPVEGGYISSPFGGARHHKGLDIAAPYGTPIYAASDGTVTFVGSGWCGGYGNCVKIQNDDGYFVIYAHMCQTQAEEGAHVTEGDVIGYVGSTGDSTGNHLHFEISKEGLYYDPQEFVTQDQ